MTCSVIHLITFKSWPLIKLHFLYLFSPHLIVNFISGEYENAAKDYAESIRLDPTFVYAHIQLGVSQYKMGSVSAAMQTFKDAIRQFPKSADLNNYYGELLLDQQKLDDAMERFGKAIELDGNNPLPYINKALLIFQFQQNMTDAEKLCRQALKGEWIIGKNCRGLREGRLSLDGVEGLGGICGFGNREFVWRWYSS